MSNAWCFAVPMQSIFQDAKKNYKEGTGKDVNLVVDEQEFLPSEG